MNLWWIGTFWCLCFIRSFWILAPLVVSTRAWGAAGYGHPSTPRARFARAQLPQVAEKYQATWPNIWCCVSQSRCHPWISLSIEGETFEQVQSALPVLLFGRFDLRQALYDTVHPWPWHNADKWISIDEAEPSWFQLFQRGDAAYAASPAVSTEAATATCQDVSASSDMPFPCSHAKCTEFHDNPHGYCQKHRWSPIWMKASCRVIKTCQWLELIFLLTIQAAAEIQSRLLLVLMMLSFLPATCIFLEHSTGMSVASACVTCLIVALGSCFYSAKRLDAMQQSVFRLAIATEAHYFQVLEARANTGHLVQVSTMLDHSGASSKVLQTEKDLKTNYFQAKRHRSLFQTSVCDPLARIGLEVAAKIKPLTELDEKEGAAGAVDVLHCEVVCESLQQVQLAWEGLKSLDVEIVSTQDFFAVTSSTKCLKIVVSLQGYLATVCLLEKSLSSLEAQRGISEVANSLGLLDKTAAATWEVGLQGVSRTPKRILMATILLRLVAFLSSLLIALKIHFMGTPRWSLWRFAMSSPFWVCSGILLWEMCTLQNLPRNFRTRLRPTQVWYRHYFGVQGCHYAFKVAALQFLTVLMQGIAKASLFRTIEDTYGPEVLQGNTAVQCFMVLLLCNIMFAAMILANPNSIVSRVVAALLDAVLDVGYLVTSIWMYVGFASEYLEDIFLHSFWNYVSIYICAAHVLCVCKSLETADWVALFQVGAAPISRAWKRMLFATVYASALMTFVVILLGGVLLGQNYGLCPPCTCSTVAPTSLLLEKCIIPTGYVALAAADVLEFNLTHRNITQVLPDAFLARGVHKSVHYVSLRGNHLTELPDRLFCDLLQVEHAEHEWDMETVDLSHNRLTVLPPRIFQAGSVRELPWIRELHLESNRLTTLPAGVFAGLTVKQLYLQRNNLTQLHPDSFKGFKLDYGILDMSRNKLQTLPPKVFEGLNMKQLQLQSNNLTLHAENFRGLFVRQLHLESNCVTTLPAGVFAGLTVKQLYLRSNNLTQLDYDSFRGLKLLDFGILDVSRNKLQTLPSRVFEGLEVEQLYLQDNDLTTLPGEVFAGLTVKQLYLRSNNLTQLDYYSFAGLKLLDYGILDVSRNKLQTLHSRAFEGLYVKQLHLQSNNLTQLHETSFRGLKFPYGSINSILDISQNKLQTLPPTVFAGLEVAQLYLQNNKLQALPGVFTWGLLSDNSINLRVLNLAHNELSEVPEFDRFDNLRSLKLEGNRLQRLHQKTFSARAHYGRGMPLEDLNLEQNQLTELHPGCFVYYWHLRENLLELKLGGNRLTALPDGLFNGRLRMKGLSELRILQLQSNQLARLPQKIFQTLGLCFSVLSDRNIQRIGAPAEPSP